MLISVLKAKLHKATVTGAVLDYSGSLAIGAGLLARSGILPFEKILVVNLSTGARFETYAIEGPDGAIVLQGGAAYQGKVGDRLMIATFALLDPADAVGFHPKILILDEANRVAEEIGPARP
ncbi:MAG: aspartate 1-decarboxylase [Planctomycetes bacterium]|nr:aspartate 1-decarboxylase [Planctomycetota bacterium]